MKAILITLLVLWLFFSVLGAIIEGLLWLTAIAVVLIIATIAYGAVKLRSTVRSDDTPR
ncbi:hypothetical protein [Cellulomonas bogoriensis]|uniref:Membrane protein n=1 Tax=Cellulomonas bogoriensis 69B4 = DSM 16987 TaxID=1386082 RepID=A0A0A0BPL3_9CELL|nr:hypothetical protein [Cellulomonas bogoriensis]KGM09602.1 membrane protein [Cellulomonas bogoriensis 69B4 = DSM 16987]